MKCLIVPITIGAHDSFIFFEIPTDQFAILEPISELIDSFELDKIPQSNGFAGSQTVK